MHIQYDHVDWSLLTQEAAVVVMQFSRLPLGGSKGRINDPTLFQKNVYIFKHLNWINKNIQYLQYHLENNIVATTAPSAGSPQYVLAGSV